MVPVPTTPTPAIDADAVVRLRGVIMRLSRQFNRSATVEGLTPSQASTLGVISFRGPISIAEVTRIEGLNPTMVSRIVGHLDEQGLIIRTANPDDLRAGLLKATRAGHEMNDRIREQRAAVVTACLERMTAQERALIVAALPALETLDAELAGG